MFTRNVLTSTGRKGMGILCKILKNYPAAFTGLECRNGYVSDTGGIGNTMLFMQDGIEIQELPMVVKKVIGVEALYLFRGGGDVKERISPQLTKKYEKEPLSLENEELLEIIEGFKRCNSVNEVLKLLEVVPTNFVSCLVAFQILKKMACLEREQVGDNEEGNNFAKTAVFNQLMDVILSSEEYSVYVQCLKLINESCIFKRYLEPYEGRLHEKIMLGVADGKCDIGELCDVAREFAKCGSENIDKLWLGFRDKFHDITENNIIDVYHLLPALRDSRKCVANTLRSRMLSVWWRLKARDVWEILAITRETSTASYKLWQILARWVNTNIHAIDEEELVKILGEFQAAQYVNSQLQFALERYVKAKGDGMEEYTWARIMDYCTLFRFRSVGILEKCAGYIIANGQSLQTGNFKAMLAPFGALNYKPTRSYEFWRVVEDMLEERLASFYPEHVLDVLTTCVYLEKYPINATNSIFNPDFLNHLQQSCDNWSKARDKLNVFDRAMTLCPGYLGPLLPVEWAFVPPEPRVKFALKHMERYLLQYVDGDGERLALFWFPPNTPFCAAFMVDALLAPNRKLRRTCYDENFVVFLLHLPEHYAGDGLLTGEQAFRVRYFKKLGFKTISLDYVTYSKHAPYPLQLQKYIDEALNTE